MLRKRPPPEEHPDDDVQQKRAKLEVPEDRGHDDVPGDVQPAESESKDDDPTEKQASASPSSTEDATAVVDAVQDGVALDGVALLECPVCVDMMQPPVRQCVNGHCVCNPCRSRVTSCPLCRGPLSFSTHGTLDHLARTLDLPCPHKALGCARRVKVTEREGHLLECLFNCGPCPLQPCDWKGAFQAARQHCLDKHPERARVTALNATVYFSLDVPDDAPVQSALRFEDVALFVDGEVFVVEVHADELPGRVVVLARQMSAGRLRPPLHVCQVALRSRARPHSALSARAPVLHQGETLVAAVDAKRCLVADLDAVAPLGAGGGLYVECAISLPAVPVKPGWFSWLFADKWTRLGSPQ